MRFVFANDGLALLYVRDDRRHHSDLLRAYRRVVDTIAAARDERTLYGLRGLRMEKLRGDRAGQYSLRVNDQYRLIVEISRDDEGNYLVVLELLDYH